MIYIDINFLHKLFSGMKLPNKIHLLSAIEQLKPFFMCIYQNCNLHRAYTLTYPNYDTKY